MKLYDLFVTALLYIALILAIIGGLLAIQSMMSDVIDNTPVTMGLFFVALGLCLAIALLETFRGRK